LYWNPDGTSSGSGDKRNVICKHSSAGSCSDTPNWANGWSDCKNEDMGSNPEYCQKGGWTCAGYVAKGWCKNDVCLPHSQTGVYACGRTLKYPEDNCCACGKTSHPAVGYTKYYDKNAYYPYGCNDIDTTDTPTGLTPEQCQDWCTQDAQCGCVTYARQTGRCWRRANCVPSGWTSEYNIGYNVYLKSA
jgi:hypothetical protein